MLAELAPLEEYPHSESSLMASVGIAHFHAGQDIPSLLACADAALHTAQGRGIPAWELHQGSERLAELRATGQRLRERLQQAIEGDLLVLQYQPVQPLQAGNGCDYRQEAWVRVVDDDGSLVRAALFMPLARRLGLLEKLDRRVVHLVLEHLAHEGAANGGATAVNLSRAAFLDPPFVAWLEGELWRQPQLARRLIIETAEHSLVNLSEPLSAAIQRLREAGARFSIDRFGQSATSVGYLRKLHVDYIKIDGSYIRDIDRSDERQFFVQALVGIAHGLGIQTIAEYVETTLELEILRGLGVDAIQGYLVGRPK
jgi:EAL domain-containing protein (putative c-di-GMP-specific phosphodiesterase class I)